MMARAMAPGSRASTVPPPGSDTTVVEPKNTSTATGMTAMASRFSPRRAVRRSSTAVWAAVERVHGAGRLTTAPPRTSREVGVLERGRVAPDLGHGPAGEDPPGGDDDDPVGQALDVDQVVAGQQDGRAGRASRRDELAGHGPGLGVHAGGRLVEDEDLGPADQGHGQRQALALAARQPPVRRRGHGPQPDEIEQLVRRSAGRRGSAAYWRSVSRGRARMSKPPSWSISPTRARWPRVGAPRVRRRGRAPSRRPVAGSPR